MKDGENFWQSRDKFLQKDPDPRRKGELSRVASRHDIGKKPAIPQLAKFDPQAWKKMPNRPYSIVFVGKDGKEPTSKEKEASKLYISQAMNLLYQVREAMKFRDLQTYNYTHEYLDGAQIRINSHFGMDKVWIKPGRLGLEEVPESCPTYAIWNSWDEYDYMPGGFLNTTMIFYKRIDDPAGPHFYINPGREDCIPPDDDYYWFEFFAVCEEDVRRGIFGEHYSIAYQDRVWEFRVTGVHSSGETFTAQDGVTYTRYGATFKAHNTSAMWDLVNHPVTPLAYSANLGEASIRETSFEWTRAGNGYYDWSVKCWIDENGDLDFSIAASTAYYTMIITNEPSYWVRDWEYAEYWDGEIDTWGYDVGIWHKVKKSEFPGGYEPDDQWHIGEVHYLIIKYDEGISRFREFDVSEGEYNAWTHSGKKIIGLGNCSFTQDMVMVTHKGMPERVISLYDTNSVSINEDYPGECFGYYNVRSTSYGLEMGYRPYMWASEQFMKTLVIDPKTKSFSGLLIYYGMCIDVPNEVVEANVKYVNLLTGAEEIYNMGVPTYEFNPGHADSTWFLEWGVFIPENCNWGGGIPDYMMIPGYNGPGDVLYKVKGEWFRFPADPIPPGAPTTPHHQECVYAAEIYKKKEWAVPKLYFDISWYYWYFGPEFRIDIYSGEGKTLKTTALTRFGHPKPPGIPVEVMDFSVGVIPL